MSKDFIYLMTFIHLKQAKLWLSLMLKIKNPTQLFKAKSNNAYKAIEILDDFLSKNKSKEEYEEDYEVSAEISDAILDIAKFGDTDREEVYTLIEKIKLRNK